MAHRTDIRVMVRRMLEPKSLGFPLGTGVALVRHMRNTIESTGTAFIAAVLLLAVLLGSACTASAQATAPRLENALSAAFYCYDASRWTIDPKRATVARPATVAKVERELKAKLERLDFKACLERFKAGRCGSDLECQTFFGGSY